MPPNPHPLVVHFPIALLIVSVLFDGIAVAGKREVFEKAALWNLIAGVLAAAMAVATGLLAEDIVPQFEVMQETMERHETLAYVTLGVFTLLLFWRVWKQGKFFVRYRAFYLLLAFVSMLSLGATAYYGGELVYKFGVGIQASPQRNDQRLE